MQVVHVVRQHNVHPGSLTMVSEWNPDKVVKDLPTPPQRQGRRSMHGMPKYMR